MLPKKVHICIFSILSAVLVGTRIFLVKSVHYCFVSLAAQFWRTANVPWRAKNFFLNRCRQKRLNFFSKLEMRHINDFRGYSCIPVFCYLFERSWKDLSRVVIFTATQRTPRKLENFHFYFEIIENTILSYRSADGDKTSKIVNNIPYIRLLVTVWWLQRSLERVLCELSRVSSTVIRKRYIARHPRMSGNE